MLGTAADAMVDVGGISIELSESNGFDPMTKTPMDLHQLNEPSEFDSRISCHLEKWLLANG